MPQAEMRVKYAGRLGLEAPEGSGIMHVQDKSGDTRHMWDSENAEEVEAAKKLFEDYTKPKSAGGKGYRAFTISDKGKKGEQVTSFDPKAGRMILVPPIQGG